MKKRPIIDPLLALKGRNSSHVSVNPDDIDSVEVPKDADATALYGTRAVNGVILIY